MKMVSMIAVYLCAAFFLSLMTSETVYSQEPVAIAGAVAVAPAAVVVPEPAAPPGWATEILMQISKLPVVGPYVSKLIMYAGILASVLTSLVIAALSILSSLQGVFNVAGFANAAKWISEFKTGKFMYWLTYFSMLNAKKPA